MFIIYPTLWRKHPFNLFNLTDKTEKCSNAVPAMFQRCYSGERSGLWAGVIQESAQDSGQVLFRRALRTLGRCYSGERSGLWAGVGMFKQLL
ncbi:hypothetical protein ANANG_G00026210 [Anguilla anguilla]|uniref:Uncharacterized protein n=1 Tax=Anguilla anguilla TaxID=7936 RepID=A0A9D3SCF1_ANGAN|nr:hypothetical protein ANANG_G00026210 [Anguilla anguilla]